MISKSFFHRAARYRRDHRFEPYEVEYKLRVGDRLRLAKDSVVRGDRDWRTQLARAMHDSEQNIVNWRDNQRLLNWCSEGGEEARLALTALWTDPTPAAVRVDRFAARLRSKDLSQPGAQLTLSSTLLMALGPIDHPPLKTVSFRRAFDEADLPGFSPREPAGERYGRAIRFLDLVVEEAQNHDVEVRNRLEAQGLVWCLAGGWKSESVESPL